MRVDPPKGGGDGPAHAASDGAGEAAEADADGASTKADGSISQQVRAEARRWAEGRDGRHACATHFSDGSCWHAERSDSAAVREQEGPVLTAEAWAFRSCGGLRRKR